MAENNVTASKDLVREGNTTSLSNLRCGVAIDAAAEIEELCKVLRDASKDYDSIDRIVRGISARMEDLSHIVMSALGDELEKTDELAYRLRLEREEVTA